MAEIPSSHVQRLRQNGLYVAEPFPSEHRWFPGGVIVSKPSDVPGNCLPDYRWGGRDGQPFFDSPVLYLHCDGEKWVVTSHDFIPGPGVGDFQDVWNSAELAIQDVLNFYFGESSRMDLKRAARADTARNSQLWIGHRYEWTGKRG